jgi:hypothetical protein
VHRSGTVFDIGLPRRWPPKRLPQGRGSCVAALSGSSGSKRRTAIGEIEGCPARGSLLRDPRPLSRAVEGAVSPASGALSLWLGVISTPMKTRAERNRVVPKGCKLWLALNPVASISTLDPYRQISPASLSRAALAEPLAPPCGCGCGSGFSDEDGLCDFPPFER